MHKNITLLGMNLRLFDGAAGAAAAPSGGDGGAAQGDVGTLPKAETTRRSGGSRRSKAGDLSNVVYGKQDAAAGNGISSPAAEGSNGAGNTNKSGVSTTSDTLEAKRQAFEEMINGEYKDFYTEKFQKAFDRRFREVKGMEESLAGQKPIMDLLMQRYNISDGDATKLLTALEQDDRYYEEAADEAGLTVEQFKTMQKLERENAELRQMRQRAQDEARRGQQAQQMQQQLNQWYAEAEEVKKLYPTFDFKAEVANRDFLGLLRSGIPVQKAYEVMHMDEIKNAAAVTAAVTAEEQVKANIRRGAARPRENGTSTNSAVKIKSDVSSLTRADRAEIARRSQRGEYIKF